MSFDVVEKTKSPRSTNSSDPISEFYNNHPYPPPVENLDRARDEWTEHRLRAEYYLLWPKHPFRAELNVLIAGCGTWQAAKFALCHPSAHVVGIDVSTTSLDHTVQLKRKYKLTNLELRQLPIESAEELNQHFDLIVSTGVLHHLADPDVGLRSLRSVLKPEGAMYMMVYAPYGRRGVYMLQDYCRLLSIGTSTEEIDDLAEVVEALPPHHPLAVLLRSARDSQNADALADALLNPRDRSYSVPQLFDFIDRNGLTFGRWYWQAPYLPTCGAISSTPHASRLASLPEREKYVAMELWRGMMTAHSLVVHRDDCSGAARTNFFTDDNWQTYVPIRLPSTLCVLERLPKGAAGVLINQAHPFHDLIMIIDPQEKRMLDAVDGDRDIASIMDHSRVTDKATARSFFEKLWWYDQVVFDASK